MATSEDAKRKREDEAEVEAKKLCTSPASIELSASPSRLSEASQLRASVQQGFLERWPQLRSWAEALCAQGEKAQDELMYWENYLGKDGETVKEQFSRQIREDFGNMCQQLIEAGCCEAEAAQATSSEAQDELCELVKHLLDLMPAESDPATSSAEKRFFALQIDVNQQGCIKFHDGRRFTTLRIQVPLHGAGPVLAAPEDVDWEFWEAEGGLLGFAQDDEEDTDLSAVEEWNKKVCKSEMWTSAGDLILLKGGELPRPVLQRFPAPSAEQLESGSHHSLLITLDHVTEEVKDQLIEMHMDPESEEETNQCVTASQPNRVFCVELPSDP